MGIEQKERFLLTWRESEWEPSIGVEILREEALKRVLRERTKKSRNGQTGKKHATEGLTQ